MKRLSLSAGATVSWQGRAVEIEAIVDLSHIKVRDPETGIVSTVHPSELLALSPSNQAFKGACYDLMEYSEKDWETARIRSIEIQPLAMGRPSKQDIAQVAARLGITTRTIYRLIKQFESNPHVSSFLPDIKSNRTRARRLDSKVEQIIEAAIDKLYLQRTRGTIQAVVLEVQRCCQQAELAAVSRKPIAARIHALDPAEVMKRRYGAKAVKNTLTPVIGKFDADTPLECIQIDHTLVDIIIVDDYHRLPIGRPWLTVAIDIHSRVVAGNNNFSNHMGQESPLISIAVWLQASTYR